MKSSWSVKQPNMSYNSWLRGEAQNSNNILSKNMVRLQEQLRVFSSVISLEEITLEKSVRLSTAVNHLMTELHLLVSIQVNK